jgi:CheY-like chemotaxis protein
MPHDRSVLLLEDDAGMQYAMQRMLTESGFRVHAAEDSDMAMQLLYDTPHLNMMVCDYRVPGNLDGVEFVRTARAMRWPMLKVLFVSLEISSVAEKTRRVPGVWLLKKPFAMTDFVSTVEQVVQSDRWLPTTQQRP